jgi:hypothetical protein
MIIREGQCSFDRQLALGLVSSVFGKRATPDNLREEAEAYLGYVLEELAWRTEKFERGHRVKKKGRAWVAQGYRGEYDLPATYALFQIAFILISPWWRDLICLLQYEPVEKSNRLGWRPEAGLSPLFSLKFSHELLIHRKYFTNGPVHILDKGEILAFSKKAQALSEEGCSLFREDSRLFVEINQMTPIEVIKEEIEKLKNLVRERQIEIMLQNESPEKSIRLRWSPDPGLSPFFSSRDADELLIWRNHIPDGLVRILDNGEILAFSKTYQASHEERCRLFRAHSHLFVEINLMAPFKILNNEIEKLKNLVQERQTEIKRQDEEEAMEMGGRPEYYEWDHRRINIYSPAVRVLLLKGIDIIDVYRSNSKKANSKFKNPPSPQETKMSQRRVNAAKTHIEAALFGNYPPIKLPKI